MDAVAALTRLGGAGSTVEVLALTTRRQLRTALSRGTVERLSRSRYALRGLVEQRRAAGRLHATLSHLSAAREHGWEVKHLPERAWLTVPRNRKVGREHQACYEIAWADLTDEEMRAGVTAPLRTVLDCARRMPFDEALAIADSALRHRAITHGDLVAAAAQVRGPGSADVRRVARHADGRAANPFESVLRAIVIESNVLEVEPQVPVRTRTWTFEPDLVDVRRRVVIEADSWTWHGDRESHSRDCLRHTLLAAAGWRVLRFTWEQVMHSAPYVRSVLDELDDLLSSRRPEPS